MTNSASFQSATLVVSLPLVSSICLSHFTYLIFLTLVPDSEIEKVVNAEREEKAFDPLRDGPLRYLGYSNELG